MWNLHYLKEYSNINKGGGSVTANVQCGFRQVPFVYGRTNNREKVAEDNDVYVYLDTVKGKYGTV